MVDSWITVLGIGDDGSFDDRHETQKALFECDHLIGGERHLAHFPDYVGQRHHWPSPFSQARSFLEGLRGERLCVLASGDPLWYGVGTTLISWFGQEHVKVYPWLSSFSLAASRLGWCLENVGMVTVHGRELSRVSRFLSPGRRLLVLSQDRFTPEKMAHYLSSQGYGETSMTVMEHLGAQAERIVQGQCRHWHEEIGADLNIIALDCICDHGGVSLLPGLDDQMYASDGVMTKRHVRTLTLRALCPYPHQLLWDVGAASGSISIEWMRAGGKAIAIEKNEKRLNDLTQNAQTLGTPDLEIIHGCAPDALKELPAPDAIFLGGGICCENTLSLCREALKPSGRLVVNSVTLESESYILDSYRQYGGDIERFHGSFLKKIGDYEAWVSSTPVTQWVWKKNDR